MSAPTAAPRAGATQVFAIVRAATACPGSAAHPQNFDSEVTA